MQTPKLSFTIGSHCDYEKLIADVGFETELIAILSQEKGFENMIIELYPKENGEPWKINLQDFLETVIKAKKCLDPHIKDGYI